MTKSQTQLNKFVETVDGIKMFRPHTTLRAIKTHQGLVNHSSTHLGPQGVVGELTEELVANTVVKQTCTCNIRNSYYKSISS